MSNVTLLNLSSEEMMNFKREGEVFAGVGIADGTRGIGGVSGIGDGSGSGEGIVMMGGDDEDVLLMDDVVGGEGGGLASIFGGDEATTVAATGGGGIMSTNNNNTSFTTNNLNNNAIYKEFRSEDDIRTYMNELMQKSMLSTGMNARMAALPRSQQGVIAGRINKALEGLLGKMIEEMGRMEGGNRVVTADVVRRCMEQMRRV